MAGVELGDELAVDTELGVVLGEDEEDADAETGALPAALLMTAMVGAVTSIPPMERTLTMRDFMDPTLRLTRPTADPGRSQKRPRFSGVLVWLAFGNDG